MKPDVAMLSEFLLFALAYNLFLIIPLSVATTVPYPSRSRADIMILQTGTDSDSNICKFKWNSFSKRSGDNRLPV